MRRPNKEGNGEDQKMDTVINIQSEVNPKLEQKYLEIRSKDEE